MTKPLIFGIGMNKTGTSSMTAALYELGMPCLHSARQVKRAVATNKLTKFPPLHPLDQKYAAFCDSPINYMFRKLDEAYPGSRFILTVRELEPWIVSRVVQFGGPASGHREAYISHVSEVLQHFADRRDDLLIYNLCGGDGWEPLCTFLHVPVPEQEFPWRNKTGRKRRERFKRTLFPHAQG